MSEYILCTNCFNDEGLIQLALSYGVVNDSTCPNCDSTQGGKLTKLAVQHILRSYFVEGSIMKVEYGGAPIMQVNEYAKPGQITGVPDWLIADYRLLEEKSELAVFDYGPRFCALGEIEPLKKLQNANERNVIFDEIFNRYPICNLDANEKYYRLRINPTIANDINEYDSPPLHIKADGRFNNDLFSCFYISSDIELCIHECRAKSEDSIYLATLTPIKQLKILDLSAIIDEKRVTEFESLKMAIYHLFLSGRYSYYITKAIAIEANKRGYNGIIYPSYFSYLRNGITPYADTIYGLSRLYIDDTYAKNIMTKNIVLFGSPIKDNIMQVVSIDKLFIKNVKYELGFGPVIY